MSSRQFIGTIKTVKLAGDYPDLEIQVTFTMPLRDAGELSFLAGVKQHGLAVVEVQSAQPELPLEEAAGRVADSNVGSALPDEPGHDKAKAFIEQHAPEAAAAAKR